VFALAGSYAARDALGDLGGRGFRREPPADAPVQRFAGGDRLKLCDRRARPVETRAKADRLAAMLLGGMLAQASLLVTSAPGAKLAMRLASQ
jgi:hypothetical protein